MKQSAAHTRAKVEGEIVVLRLLEEVLPQRSVELAADGRAAVGGAVPVGHRHREGVGPALEITVAGAVVGFGEHGGQKIVGFLDPLRRQDLAAGLSALPNLRGEDRCRAVHREPWSPPRAGCAGCRLLGGKARETFHRDLAHNTSNRTVELNFYAYLTN